MKKTIGLLALVLVMVMGLPAFAQAEPVESPRAQITELVLNRSSGTILVGKTAQLKITAFAPSDATAQTKPVWRSSNNAIVSVSNKGKIKALHAGVESITCTVDGVTATCVVTVVTKADLYKAEVISLVNQQRANRGLAPLRSNETLQEAADVRAREIIVRFAHERPDGSLYSTALPPMSGYRISGENIAAGYANPKAVVRGWMNSQGHRENILYSDFTDIGIGLAARSGRIYWVQLFWG